MKQRISEWLTTDRIAAVLFLFGSMVYGLEGWTLTATLQVDVVGPALFPKLLTVLGVTLSLLLLLKPISKPDRRFLREPALHAELPVLGVLALLVCYVLSFEVVGFVPSTFFFLAFAFRYLRQPTWRGAWALSALLTAAFYGLFVYLLGVKLPPGLWWPKSF